MKFFEVIEHARHNRWGDDFVFMEINGKAMGRVYFYHDEPNIAFIEGLSVLESERGKGIGRVMFGILMRKCKELNAKECMLWCYKDEWVIDWYQRMGFCFFDTHKDEDNAVWLVKEF